MLTLSCEWLRIVVMQCMLFLIITIFRQWTVSVFLIYSRSYNCFLLLVLELILCKQVHITIVNDIIANNIALRNVLEVLDEALYAIRIFLGKEIWMVTDKPVRILTKLTNQERTLETAAAKAGMCEKAARKYRQSGKLHSQCKPLHTRRTRQDPFDEDDWNWVEDFLETNPGLEAKTLFEALQCERPGKYQDGQLRIFQRKVKV